MDGIPIVLSQKRGPRLPLAVHVGEILVFDVEGSADHLLIDEL